MGHKTYKMHGILMYIYVRNEVIIFCDCVKGNTVARIIGKRDNESDYPCVYTIYE